MIQHPGTQHVVDSTERSTGSSPFTNAFFADPFNQLVARTPDLPCEDRWDIFSPPDAHGVDRSHAYRLEIAKKLCARCPIEIECLEFAMRPGPLGGVPDESGIWAGTTELDREQMHAKRAAQQVRATSMPQSSNDVEEGSQ